MKINIKNICGALNPFGGAKKALSFKAKSGSLDSKKHTVSVNESSSSRLDGVSRKASSSLKKILSFMDMRRSRNRSLRNQFSVAQNEIHEEITSEDDSQDEAHTYVLSQDEVKRILSDKPDSPLIRDKTLPLFMLFILEDLEEKPGVCLKISREGEEEEPEFVQNGPGWVEHVRKALSEKGRTSSGAYCALNISVVIKSDSVSRFNLAEKNSVNEALKSDLEGHCEARSVGKVVDNIVPNMPRNGALQHDQPEHVSVRMPLIPIDQGGKLQVADSRMTRCGGGSHDLKGGSTFSINSPILVSVKDIQKILKNQAVLPLVTGVLDHLSLDDEIWMQKKMPLSEDSSPQVIKLVVMSGADLKQALEKKQLPESFAWLLHQSSENEELLMTVRPASQKGYVRGVRGEQLNCQLEYPHTPPPANNLSKNMIGAIKVPMSNVTESVPLPVFYSEQDSLASETSSNHSVENDVALYGGKYAGLKKLTDGLIPGLHVPEFVGMSAEEIALAIEVNKLPERVTAFLHRFSEENVRWMVRSSSSQEDQAEQANAGCFLTVPNVRNRAENLLQAIAQVKESFSSESAKAQSAIYGTSLSQNHGAIVIQRMIGESPDNTLPTMIPRSGVGLSPDPRSRVPGTFNINGAYGHGEAVVQGLVPTDETIGVFAQTGELHARTIVRKQDQRLMPDENSHKLAMRQIPEELQRQSVLPEASVERYATLLNALTKAHKNGADIEFVTQNSQDYVVQQRAQDALSTRGGQPGYLSETVVKELKNASSQPIKTKDSVSVYDDGVDVISYGSYGVNFLNKSEYMTAHSLDEAYTKNYLNMSKEEQSAIKAVFVKPPANPNAHAALMFRQSSVSIIQVNDRVLDCIESSDNPILLDEQRALLGLGVPFSEVQVQSGYLSYPAPAVYSVPTGAVKAFSEHQERVLKTLWDICDNTPKDELKRLALMGRLNQLKVELRKSNQLDTSAVKGLLAGMLYQAGVLLKLPVHNEVMGQKMKHLAYELTTDVIRLFDANENKAPKMHQLLYLNWIEAALRQVPQEHLEVSDVVSVKSLLAENKTQKSCSDWLKQEKLVGHSDQELFSDLHRLSYAIVRKDLKDFWLSCVSAFAQQDEVTPNVLKNLILACATQSQNGSFELMLMCLKVQSEAQPEKSVSIDDFLAVAKTHCESQKKLETINRQYDQMRGSWSNPLNFKHRLEALVGLESQIYDSIAEIVEPVGNASPQQEHEFSPSRTFRAMGVLNDLEKIYENLDMALKAIVSAPDYGPKREVHFKELLCLFRDVSKPLLDHAYNGSYKNNLNTFYSDFDDLHHILNSSLTPSAGFNVSAAVVDRVVGSIYVAKPITVGDVHTLLHQNVRMAQSNLAVKAGSKHLLPMWGREVDDSLPVLLDKRCSDEHRYIKDSFGLKLLSVNLEGNLLKWQYAMPLRDHGFRVGFSYNTNTNEKRIAIAMDGGDENCRYSHSIALLQSNKKYHAFVFDDFRIGKQTWLDPDVAPEHVISWSEKNDESQEITHRIMEVLRFIRQVSYDLAEFSEESENKFAIPFLAKWGVMPRSDNEVNKRAVRLANYFIQQQESKKKIIEENFEEKVHDVVENSGLLKGEVSLLEFARVLRFSLIDQSFSRKLLETNPDIFWIFSDDHLKDLDRVLNKKNVDLQNKFLELLPLVVRPLLESYLYMRPKRFSPMSVFSRAVGCLISLMECKLSIVSIKDMLSYLREEESGFFDQLEIEIRRNGKNITDKDISDMIRLGSGYFHVEQPPSRFSQAKKMKPASASEVSAGKIGISKKGYGLLAGSSKTVSAQMKKNKFRKIKRNGNLAKFNAIMGSKRYDEDSDV